MTTDNARRWLWGSALILLAIVPPIVGVSLQSSSLLATAAIFALYAAINLIWMLVIGTAGIFSLATLAIVGVSAYFSSWLSINYGLPWWAMIPMGGVLGLLFGIVIALPANRLEGYYYALLTLGLAELCRVVVIQSDTLGSASGGLFGADSYLPDGLDSVNEQLVGYVGCFVVMLAALALYRWCNDRRVGALLRSAPERHEAFAAACGVDYKRARNAVFLISSCALGLIGGFYATHFRGASPSLFGMDNLMMLLAMIVIGGMGTARGVIIGTLLVVGIDHLLLDLGALRIIIVGLVMLCSAVYTNQGLIGIKAQWRAFKKRGGL